MSVKAPTTRPQLMLVRMRDRRNHFARESLRRVVSAHFAGDNLAITAAAAAQRFQLPLPLCERLLEELVHAGTLARSAAGSYSTSGQRLRLVPPATRANTQ